MVHIDDFLLGGSSEEEALHLAKQFDKMCDELNVKISTDKNEDGIQIGVVHGFGFNLKNRPKTVHIPFAKMMDMLNAVMLLQVCRLADGVALEAVSGKFMHWSQFRKETKSLCYRLLSDIHKTIRKNPKLKWQIFRVPDVIMRDLIFWVVYMVNMRVITMESIISVPSITIIASTDACEEGGAYVIGANYGAYFFRETQNEFGIIHSDLSIDKLEAHAVIMLLWNNRLKLAGKQLLLYVDNKSIMYSIFRNWSGSPELMEYIQEIKLIQCVYSIGVHVDYIPSEFNELSDSLSRDDWEAFYECVDLFELEMNSEPDDLEYYESLRFLRGKQILSLHKR